MENTTYLAKLAMISLSSDNDSILIENNPSLMENVPSRRKNDPSLMEKVPSRRENDPFLMENGRPSGGNAQAWKRNDRQASRIDTVQDKKRLKCCHNGMQLTVARVGRMPLGDPPNKPSTKKTSNQWLRLLADQPIGYPLYGLSRPRPFGQILTKAAMLGRYVRDFDLVPKL
jgi:hypothetical protein